MRVVHFLEDVGFLEERLLVLFGEFFLFYLLHGADGVGDLVGYKVDSAIASFAEDLADDVGVGDFVFVNDDELALFNGHSGEGDDWGCFDWLIFNYLVGVLVFFWEIRDVFGLHMVVRNVGHHQFFLFLSPTAFVPVVVGFRNAGLVGLLFDFQVVVVFVDCIRRPDLQGRRVVAHARSH